MTGKDGIPKTNEGYIYLISDGTYTKIGKTSGCPLKRLRSLQTGNPNKLTLLHVIACSSPIEIVERRLHDMLWQHRVHRMRGEWFYLSSDYLEWLSSMNTCSDVLT